MKIGIITFHWAANHGAILQTHALCSFLEKTYQATVKVIDYYPKHMEHTTFNALKRRRPSSILQGLREGRKNQQLRSFRETLPLTKRFYSNAELMQAELDMDILITGSDQIWNPSFLRYGEKGGSAVYYLNFGTGGQKKLSVSASFGCNVFPADCHDAVSSLLKRFSAISVRENTGLEILQSLSVNGGVVTADPTALLSREEYLDICSKQGVIPDGSVTKMILRKQSKEQKQLISQICAKFSDKQVFDLEYLSMPDWLAAIRDSKMVVTNSFHCVMMCLKLHTPFVVITEKRADGGMNDRFLTLLGRFHMLDRIVTSVDDLKKVPEEIDFKEVDLCMGEYAGTLASFLERNIC